MTTLPGAEDKPMDTHVNTIYHNPKCHLPLYNLNQSGNPLKNHTVFSAAATNISRPNVFGTDAISAIIWPQDIVSWIAQNSQEEDQHQSKGIVIPTIMTVTMISTDLKMEI